MNPEQTALVARIRALTAGEPTAREVSMFGGRSLMIREKMIVSALKHGSLLVRVDAARHDELLARPGAMRATMGSGRTMGPGWIEVAAEAIGDDAQLSAWLSVALDFNRAVTGGRPVPRAGTSSV